MTIEEIFAQEGLSVRSINICKAIGLKDIHSLLMYYKINKSFIEHKYCGRKSNEELIRLCNKYIDKFNNGVLGITTEEEKLISTISNLTRTQREIINSYIDININSLSNRSRNALLLVLNGNIKIRTISEMILSNKQFKILDIKNIGPNTASELKYFIDSIKNYTNYISSLNNEKELICIKNKHIIEKEFSSIKIPNEILNSQSIFKLVDFLISENAFFDKNRNVIFKKAFRIYNNNPEQTLDEIAEEVNITRERVRQLRKYCLDELFNTFKFIKHIDDDLLQKYGIDLNKNLIFIDEDLSNLINKINNTDFSSEFITYLIYIHNFNKLELVGNIEDVLQVKLFKTRDRHNWNRFYLIKSSICNTFHFNDFVDDLNFRINERIEESYTFNLKSYLITFFETKKIEALNEISEVAETILNNEFKIYIDIDDNIRFNRKSQIQPYEYSHEALKILGKPSKVDEIKRKIEELHPDYETNIAKIRASMRRQYGFIPIGRASIFGLIEWQNKLENFKGGTIRSIVTEYLETKDEPKHISDITEYVLKYRPNTYERSILDNLKGDKSNSFLFYKNSIIGLSSKKYSKSLNKLKSINPQITKSWEERYNDLTSFVNQNHRLPLSSGNTDFEIKLYRWYKIQVGKTKNGEIEEEKSNLINEIIKKFQKGESTQRTNTNNIGRRKKVRSNSKYTYEDLTEFISINKRMPDSRDPNESSLYQFYYRNKKNLENIDALSTQEAKLVELIEKFGSSKYTKFTIDELMEFIKINKRMPDSRKNNERGLYQFAYKQKKLFEEGELDQLEVNKFVEISKTIQNHKYENKRN